MSDFQRQHPVASITRAVEVVRGNLVTIIVLLVAGASGSEGSAFLWWFVGLFVFVLVAGIVGWWRFVYRIEDGELQIKQGIMVRKNLYLTRDRVQVIDVTAGVIQRVFGLVSVDIKTAASSSREASLSAVSKSEAERITKLLRNGTSASVDESVDGMASLQGEKKSYPIFHLPGKELIIAASTSGSFGIALSIIATVFSQIEPLISESQMYEWFITIIPSETDGMLLVMFILLFVIFAWLMSFFGTLITYGDFKLTLKEEEMVISRGIFEKKRITVPFNRIQAVRVVEGLLRQPLGYATIQVESAGYGDQKNSGSVVVFPLMKSSQIDGFLRQILPEYCTSVKAMKPPARSVTRYIIRTSIAGALLIAGIYWVLDAPGFIWLLAIPGAVWGWLRHRDAAVGVDKERIIIRSRLLARTTAFVRKNRAQDMNIRSSWIQHFRGLANLNVSVASGDQGRQFRVRELDADTAMQLLPWIMKKYDGDILSDVVDPSDRMIPGW